MKKIQILFAAMLAVCMTSCFKTEAQVDVEVLKNGQPQSGVVVYKFTNEMGDGSTSNYKENANAQATTNAGGVAHFDLKSPEDFTPSKIGNVEVKETNTFYFATFDSEDRRNGFVAVKIATGEKKTVQLEITENQVD